LPDIIADSLAKFVKAFGLGDSCPKKCGLPICRSNQALSVLRGFGPTKQSPLVQPWNDAGLLQRDECSAFPPVQTANAAPMSHLLQTPLPTGISGKIVFLDI